MQGIRADIIDLAITIADEAARSDLEIFLDAQKHSGPHAGIWYDTSQRKHEHRPDFVVRAIRYMEARERIERHPKNADLIRLLQEPQA